MSPPQAPVRFGERQLASFARASGDRNPIHVSAAYAQRTPHGERVVFGGLVLLALAARTLPPGLRPSACEVRFRQPVRLDADYAAHADPQRGERLVATLCGDGAVVARASFALRGRGRPVACGFGSARTRRRVPRDWPVARLAEGAGAAGAWGASARGVAALRRALDAAALPDDFVLGVLWSSYVVGMELPGERGLLSRLALQVDGAPAEGASLAFEARVVEGHDGLDVITVKACLHDSRPVARLEAEVVVRRPPLPLDAPLLRRRLASLPPVAPQRTALVAGASRGLGRALAHGLALAGYETYALSRDGHGEGGAGRGRAGAAHGGDGGDGARPHALGGDAADPRRCRALRTRIAADRGGLDVLVCCAAPPLRPLRFAPDALDALCEHVGRGTALVAAPLATWLPELDARGGTCVIASSTAVESAPPHWSHYVTAKRAVEGLVQWAAVAFPRVRFLVARLPRLLTDQSNTPVVEAGALAVEPVAAAVVRAVAAPGAAGVVLLEQLGAEVADER